MSNKIDALIEKEVKAIFKIDTFTKQAIPISNEINESLPIKITETNFFKIISEDALQGFYYLGHAYGKADYFDFIVIFDKNLVVSKVKILVYREDHGGEVGSTRWLKQFIGKITTDNLIYQKDIAAISGATISAKSMTNEVNKLFRTIAILNTKKQL
ncbi:FMN-binding protein [Lutibacter sp.]|uniref:FMN-binding protein n=1 Tax=Lutibacter sp. TaxID=1925666 RepID=UPI00356855B7